MSNHPLQHWNRDGKQNHPHQSHDPFARAQVRMDESRDAKTGAHDPSRGDESKHREIILLRLGEVGADFPDFLRLKWRPGPPSLMWFCDLAWADKIADDLPPAVRLHGERHGFHRRRQAVDRRLKLESI